MHNSQSSTTKSGYFPHIDGIRSLAILPVLFYHLFPDYCPGGFIGVDVFFVISGYLIVGGIARELNANRFSFLAFYHRRIRRILPAYVGMMIGVFALSILIYYSLPFVRTSHASIYTTFFSANLLFYKLDNGYFNPDTHNNPLLHMWSLSVEEQFYLLVPLVLFLSYRLYKRSILPLLFLVLLASFVWVSYAVHSGYQTAAFYLLQFRAWELLSGAILAVLDLQYGNAESKYTKVCSCLDGWAPILGLVLVLAPYAMVKPSYVFPGPIVLPSIIGTLLLIKFGKTGHVGQLLSSKPMVFVGRISYSLYLWHWPIIVFYRYVTYDQLVVADYAIMASLSFLFAYLSYRYIERPTKDNASWTPKTSFAFAFTALPAMLVIGLWSVFSSGFADYIHHSANRIAKYVPPEATVNFKARAAKLQSALGMENFEPIDRQFLLGYTGNRLLGDPKADPSFLLIGDSHAAAFSFGFHNVLTSEQLSAYRVVFEGELAYDLSSKQGSEVLAEISKRPTIDKIVIVQFWARYNFEKAMGALERFIETAHGMGKKVFVLSDNPVFEKPGPTDILCRMQDFTPRHYGEGYVKLTISKHQYDNKNLEINSKLQAICSKYGSTYVPLHQAFQGKDEYISFMEMDGHTLPFYRDDDHLAPVGSSYAATFVRSWLLPSPTWAAKQKKVTEL